ncbi:cytidine and dCMP deaminase domain-containing protein 1-like isoform X3 [Emydura macquarii macquarii]|uniref:cytidine and dCMP deaminase domain-containing protein 1-like isoform X3 n=1 Tax=Emydura macquarii macquarii TaxID=1129001 RepID=UPI00352AAA87
MENSPNCQEPSCRDVGKEQQKANTLKFFKTGIVICEANKPKRIITMDCSTKDLHAVPKALLRFPNELRGGEVYLSRMPCISCAKLLSQAQVSQVYYWPNLEMETTEVNLNKIEVEAELVDNIFRESYITAAVYIPILDVETVKDRICRRTGSPPIDKNTTQITSVFDHKRSQRLLEILNLTHIKKDEVFKVSYENDVDKAMESFQTLAGGIDTDIKENNFKDDKHSIESSVRKYTHALQLCNLLAARSDSPNDGVGTLIYRKEDIVTVGYNGFPKGTVNSLFAQKDDGSCDQHAIICSEANAIILRTEEDLSDTELITTCEPCSVCESLIKAMKIKKIIWPNRDKKTQPEGTTNNPTEEKDPSSDSFLQRGKDKKRKTIQDKLILEVHAEQEKYKRKDTEGTSVSGEKEEEMKKIQSPADERHTYGQAVLNSSEASASHRNVKEDNEKTNPLLSETESELETESLGKPKESHNEKEPSVNAAEDESL